MLKLTGGSYRGIPLKTPKTLKTRPTSARLREAIFNILRDRVEGAQVLDLFAGTGALGLEALSRGARSAVFIESHRPTSRLVQENLDKVNAESGSVWTLPVEKAAKRCGTWVEENGAFDLVFADPPYRKGLETAVLEKFPWKTLLSENGCLMLETESSADTPENPMDLVKTSERKYGDTKLTFYGRS